MPIEYEIGSVRDVLDLRVPLQHERRDRRRERDVDEARLQPRQDVGDGQHGRRQAQAPPSP